MAPLTLLDRLKTETRPAHDRIERMVDIEGRTTSPASYRALVARFYGFHAAWEPRAEAALGDGELFRGRRKTHLLVRDLRALGLSEAEIARLPLCDLPLPMAGPAAALGAMYVVEGSTLGGTIIARLAERRLGLSPEAGCAYFRSYGPDVGAMWRSFRARLLAASSPATDDAVVACANLTFAVMQAWLADERPRAAHPRPMRERGAFPHPSGAEPRT